MIEWAKRQTDELYSIIDGTASTEVLKKWSRLLKVESDEDAILDAALHESLIYCSSYHEEEDDQMTLCNINRIAVFVTARTMHIDEEYAKCVVVKKAIDDAARLGKSITDVYVPNEPRDFFGRFQFQFAGLHLESLIPEEENDIYYLGQDGTDFYTRY